MVRVHAQTHTHFSLQCTIVILYDFFFNFCILNYEDVFLSTGSTALMGLDLLYEIPRTSSDTHYSR